MRKEGFRVEVYLKPGDKLSKQIKSAADRKIPVIAIIGPDEASQDLVMLRTGPQNQYTVPCAEAAAQLRTLLNAAMCDV
jgi:threonyl-tRNA synthetase